MHQSFTVRVLLASLIASPSFALDLVADIAPAHSILSAVSGQNVKLLIRPGEDVHTFSLRPSAAKKIAEADLTVSAVVPLNGAIALQGGHQDEDNHAHEHAHEWLSADTGIEWAELFAQKLAELDPGNAENYRKNADDVIERLNALNNITWSTDTALAVTHDAFDAFTEHYGLPSTVALRGADDQAVGAASRAEFNAKISDLNCLLYEAHEDPAKIAPNLRAVQFSPIPTDIPIGPDFYTQTLEKLLSIAKDCA